MLDPETVPVVVGVGRYTQKRGTPILEALSPIDIMAWTCRLAGRDATDSFYSSLHLLKQVDAVAVVQSATEARICHKFPRGLGTNISPNWPKSLGKAVGIKDLPWERCYQTYDGGNSSQMLINSMAEKISNKEIRSVLVSGCEVLSTLMSALSKGEIGAAQIREKWNEPLASSKTPVRVGPEYCDTEVEIKHGLHVPIRVYPLFEQAYRSSLDLSVEDHMLNQSKMFSGFSKVAAENPEHSWFPTERSPEDIASPNSRGNKWVGYPYTKYHCAVMNVDQSASVIIMSEAEAMRRGISKSKWIYLHGCADTIEKMTLRRPQLHRSPAMRIMGREVAKASNIGSMDMIKYKDIYSCFPIAVSVVARELGFDPKDGTKLTLTGGLPYHGGPGSNYSLHGLVALASKLRADPGSYGLITANGGYFNKHSAGIYSTTPYHITHPNAVKWSRMNPKSYQCELDNGPEVKLSNCPEGLGTVETYTVVHKGKGNEYRGIVIGKLNESQERFVATSNDTKLMRIMKSREFLGQQVNVSTDNHTGISTFRTNIVNSSL
uniref:Thiolase-like protein type 1 additional C-terminal domain-containing protein n=1 Tax=Aplanochytrium stocchinoi TaxID=215587 RepID=A0A6S8F9P6_9STRA|mmetsp:Transcript_25249/g.30824  ORF Transcript_25249/g.30824 Transcript_25249/m.30824 type:complete len:548 (+) Transcript_25249:185-1828(+)